LLEIASDLFGLVLRGIFLGSFYGLLALGLSLIYGVQNVINIAHGDFMIGAFIAFFSWSMFNVNPLLSLLVIIPIMFVLGAIVQSVLIERIQGEVEFSSLLLTFGLMYTIQNLGLVAFTGDYRTITYLGSSMSFAGATFPMNRPVMFAVALAMTGLLFGFLKFSDWGKAVRATSQNPDVAKACGINTKQVRMVSFGLGTVAAGVAGGLAGILFTIYPAMGLDYILRAFVIVVLGGLGSLVGAVLGGLIFGIIEVVGTFYYSSTVAAILAFVMLFALLVVRPHGLLGEAKRRK
jgi:branched-chain amino acid transport system permease protein